jgi:extracellular elastinolytic metalloproteinase
MRVSHNLLMGILLCCTPFLGVSQNIGIKTANELLGNVVNTELAQKFSGFDLTQTRLAGTSTSQKSGLTHYYFQQTVSGIAIHNAIMNVTVDADGKVLQATHTFTPKPASAVRQAHPEIQANNALLNACAHLGLDVSPTFTPPSPENTSVNSGKFNEPEISRRDIDFRLVYQVLNKRDVRLAWEFVILTLDGQDWWQIRMDAQTGEFLDKNNWMVSCAIHPNEACHKTTAGRIEGSRNPFLPLLTNTYNVYPIPVESPSHGGRSLLTAPWTNNLSASPFGWHDTDGSSGAEFTITRGNNVWAQEDINADNGTGYSPDGGASLDFDYPIDLTQAPATYQDAAITNLFYFNNVMHDVWYNYGFDEESGNFQENNYGNPGLGSDFVFGDAQDGGGTNNANFGTPPDGESPRMQMFLWTGAQAPLFEANGINYSAVVADFGAQEGTWNGNLIIADDGSAVPTEACNPLINGGGISGNIAVIDRGNCTFVTKVQNAQDAGAIAVVVVNNVAGAPTPMGGTSGTITIPAIMISLDDGNFLKNEIISGTVNATITLSGNVDRDGDFDNGIIVHEYGHGISSRLTGGPSIVSCLTNTEQMGEGWSDYFALMMTIEPGDIAEDPRPIGTFAIGTSTQGPGIRTYSYSTDMGINPHTYLDIANESVPHGVGSVWCAMLWDMTWALIDQYGFDPDLYNGTGGNNLAMQLVMDGLKLQPCNPGFVDGRDAILIADEINNGGVNQCLIWDAFAQRGLGYSADQASSASVTDGSEGYDMPPLCTLGITKNGPSEVLAGQSVTYTLTVENATDGEVTNVVVTDEIPPEVNYTPGSSSCSAILNGSTLTIDLGTIPANTTIECTYQVEIPDNPFSIILFEDNIENGTGSFTTTSEQGTDNWSISSTKSNSPVNSWFATDPDGISDQYLALSNIGPLTSASELSFWHNYNTETAWDGGVLEVSTNGIDWTDLGGAIIQNGYNGTIEVNPASPISGQAAFTGNSGGFIQTIVDLAFYDGQMIDIRWRMASDEFVAGDGWYVDDINVNDALIDFINQACVSSNEFSTSCDEVYSLVLEPNCTLITWFEDADEDGFGNPDITFIDCLQPVGYAENNQDCDDTDSTVYPDAPGTGLDIDNNCNGQIDPAESGECLGDFNEDGFINVADLLMLLGEFGCQNNCITDMNNDSLVNSADMLSFLSVFGTVCP